MFYRDAGPARGASYAAAHCDREPAISATCSISSRSALWPTWFGSMRNNRVLVTAGLEAHSRRSHACRESPRCFAAAGRDPRAPAYDLGLCAWTAAQCRRAPHRHVPRHRMPRHGRSRACASDRAQLDALNRERREIEGDMQESALARLRRVNVEDEYAIVLSIPNGTRA